MRAHPRAAQSIASKVASSAATVQVVEYYNAALNKYFMSADPVEIQALDSGTLRGWLRTGNAFEAYPPSGGTASSAPVCRYYGLPAAGLDSHFYSATECDAVGAIFGASWVLESSNVFRVELADRVTGTCAVGSPVYRLLHTEGAANHRYVTDAEQRAQMIAAGYVSEGYGPDGVIFCSAVPVSATAAPKLARAHPHASRRNDRSTVSFGAIVSATGSADIARYSWKFGDGGSSARMLRLRIGTTARARTP